MSKKVKHKVLSLFANIGVAEAYLDDIGIKVCVANELIKKRADIYQRIYPATKVITGSILDSKVFDRICEESIKQSVSVVMATPPCQGMSTAGEQNPEDERNILTMPALEAIKRILPKYAIIENVANYVNTCVVHNGERLLLTDIIKNELGNEYNITVNIINTEDFGVPQSRERVIVLLSRKDMKEWSIPAKHDKIVTMKDAIGDLPEVDPFVKDIPKDEFESLFPLFNERAKKAREISRWHVPPTHIYRQVIAMRYTPTGKTAFDNDTYKPRKEDGTLVRGYRNTYMRQKWDTPAYTITMDNRKISSQGNVHPGRYIGNDANGVAMYSDPRVLTLYEIMRIMSLPEDWALPHDVDEAFIRRIIGEGIPPYFVKQLFENIPNE